MITDAQLNFVPLTGQSLVGGSGVSFPSTNTIDLLGLGVGVAPTPSIIGNVTLFGAADAMGVGGMRPELVVAVGTAFTTSSSATLNVQLQGAADSGTPTYLPGTWNTFAETGTISAANLTAGQFIARFPWLPPFPPGLRPRYLRLNFAIASGTSFTAGTIAFALVTTVRDDMFNRYGANNFVVA